MCCGIMHVALRFFSWPGGLVSLMFTAVLCVPFLRPFCIRYYDALGLCWIIVAQTTITVGFLERQCLIVCLEHRIITVCSCIIVTTAVTHTPTANWACRCFTACGITGLLIRKGEGQRLFSTKTSRLVRLDGLCANALTQILKAICCYRRVVERW